MLVPKADRRKDWEDKAMVGYFIEYSKSKVVYRVLLGDTVITSVHVLFDESIPERSADYFRALRDGSATLIGLWVNTISMRVFFIRL